MRRIVRRNCHALLVSLLLICDAAAGPQDEPPAAAAAAPALAPTGGDAPDEQAAETEIEEPTDLRLIPEPPEEEGELEVDVGLPSESDAAPSDVDELIGVEADPQVAPAAARPTQRTLSLLGTDIAPGSFQRLSWSVTEAIEGLEIPSPVLVVNGTKPGPTLCLTAAVHGDELNGVEVVRRVVHHLNPQSLSGAVIGVPIVNVQGFNRNSRYLPDRRDLNRYFPGNANGSSASRIAFSLFAKIISNCTALVDLHTGSFHRTNLTQIRGDLRNPRVIDLTQGLGETAVLHSTGVRGSLRRAATDAGIPAVTMEAGEPMRLQPKHVNHGVAAVETLMDSLGMLERSRLWSDPAPIYYSSKWVRADRGGIFMTAVQLGERVAAGELLGTVTDPITNEQSRILSPFDGRVLGMALNQVVRPGFATFHIGIRTNRGEAAAQIGASGEADGGPNAEGGWPDEGEPGDGADRPD